MLKKILVFNNIKNIYMNASKIVKYFNKNQ